MRIRSKKRPSSLCAEEGLFVTAPHRKYGGSHENEFNLDKYEKEIEGGLDAYVPVAGEKRRRVTALLERDQKRKNINIRISENDLAALKEKAEQEGVPYQTLIASVLHKYIRDRLVDEKDILKSLELLTSRSWGSISCFVQLKASPGFSSDLLPW